MTKTQVVVSSVVPACLALCLAVWALLGREANTDASTTKGELPLAVTSEPDSSGQALPLDAAERTANNERPPGRGREGSTALVKGQEELEGDADELVGGDMELLLSPPHTGMHVARALTSKGLERALLDEVLNPWGAPLPPEVRGEIAKEFAEEFSATEKLYREAVAEQAMAAERLRARGFGEPVLEAQPGDPEWDPNKRTLVFPEARTEHEIVHLVMRNDE